MRIGQFFSLSRGRVGQFLSPRVLVARVPFQTLQKRRELGEWCYFGFDSLRQAQKFVQSLARFGSNHQLRRSEMLVDCPYEVVLPLAQIDLARTLAYWDRRDQSPTVPAPTMPSVISKRDIAIAA